MSKSMAANPLPESLLMTTKMTKDQRAVLDRVMDSGKKWSDPTLSAEEKDAIDACMRASEYERKHESQGYITCPHCLYVDNEMCDYPSSLDRDGDDTEMECVSCDQSFKVELHIEYSYSTSLIENEDDEPEVLRIEDNPLRPPGWESAEWCEDSDCHVGACHMCTGQACCKCGAAWPKGDDRPDCEHDVVERHESPETGS